MLTVNQAREVYRVPLVLTVNQARRVIRAIRVILVLVDPLVRTVNKDRKDRKVYVDPRGHRDRQVRMVPTVIVVQLANVDPLVVTVSTVLVGRKDHRGRKVIRVTQARKVIRVTLAPRITWRCSSLIALIQPTVSGRGPHKTS